MESANGPSVSPGDANSALTLRPIQPTDEALWLDLMRSISWATRYKRGARRVEDLTPEDVRRAVTLDPEKELGFVMVAEGEEEARMVGVCRGARSPLNAWVFTLVVLDEWQRRGVGRRLLGALIDALEARGARRIEGDVLASNRNMLDFVEELGFEIRPHPSRSHLKLVVRTLSSAP
jgi:acetyltransferase